MALPFSSMFCLHDKVEGPISAAGELKQWDAVYFQSWDADHDEDYRQQKGLTA